MRGERFLAVLAASVLVLSVLVPVALADGHGDSGDHEQSPPAASGRSDTGSGHGNDKGSGDSGKGHSGSDAVSGQSTDDSVYGKGHGQDRSTDDSVYGKNRGSDDAVYGKGHGSDDAVYGKGHGSDDAVYGNCAPNSGLVPVLASGFNADFALPHTGTTSDTASASGSTYGSTTDSTYGSTTDSTYGNCGRDLGEEHHLAAVQKVLDKLKDKLESLNPTAAANVQQVIDRLTAELQAAGVSTSADQAVYDLTKTLQDKARNAKASKSDLDVLAALQSQSGDESAARNTRLQRIAADPTDRNGYLALGEQESKDHGPPSDISAFVNGKAVKFDVKPFVKDGHTLVPVRAILEALGAQLGWNQDAQTVTIQSGNKTIQMQIGSNTATVNGQTVRLDAPASIEGGRTVVPLRAVAEMLGMKVEWLGDYKMIVITPTGTTSGATTGTGSGTGTGTGTGP